MAAVASPIAALRNDRAPYPCPLFSVELPEEGERLGREAYCHMWVPSGGTLGSVEIRVSVIGQKQAGCQASISNLPVWGWRRPIMVPFLSYLSVASSLSIILPVGKSTTP